MDERMTARKIMKIRGISAWIKQMLQFSLPVEFNPKSYCVIAEFLRGFFISYPLTSSL
jgi:hypothetical protein